ncbi:MAG: VWA domain-containing protein [Alphaproteobacteria bacterium]|nr:VWA domain-containing protein [Alphaproteobacteria bacterium]
MERPLNNFIRALRAAEIPVSTGEAMDAFRTAALLGYDDRSALKRGLAATMAKTLEEAETFDRIFDLYFRRGSPPASASPESAGAGGEAGPAPRDLAELARQGDATELSLAFEAAAEEVGVQRIQFSTQVGYFARRMLDVMGLQALEGRLIDRLRTGGAEAEAEAEELMAIRARLTGEARRIVEREFETFGQSATEAFRADVLRRRSLGELDRRDMERMKVLIQKMARRLAAKYSRRRRKRKTGQLDLRRTMRANAGVDGVPFTVHWRAKRRDRAKVVAICDTSQSVARSVRFLLLFLYSLTEVIPDIRSFAFSSRLKEVSGDFEDLDFETAMEKVLKEVGYGATNYGQALSDFVTDHPKAVDRRTTVIILGDGRSNYANPRLDLFKDIAAQAKAVIWLTPEGPSLWGTGDSEIQRYRAHCSALAHCTNAADLERAIDDVLASYQG